MATLPDTIGHRREGRRFSNKTKDLFVEILKVREAVFCLCEECLPLERGVCSGVEGAQSSKCTSQD